MEKLELKDFLKFNYLSNLKTNIRKNRVSFVRSIANYEKNSYTNHLYVGENETFSRIHTFEGGAQYYWYDDTQLLVNVTNSDETKARKTTFSLYNSENGELEPFVTFKIPVSSLSVLDAQTLLISSFINEDDLALLDDAKRGDYIKDLDERKDYEVFESIPFYGNGSGFSKNKRSVLFIYKVETQTYTQVSALSHSTAIHHVDLDQHKVYLTQTQVLDVPNFTSLVSVYDYKNDTLDVLYNKEDNTIRRVIVLNDDVYVLANTMEAHGINQNSDFFKVEANTLIPVAPFGLSASNSIGSDVRLGGSSTDYTHDNVYYFVGTYHDRTRVYAFDGKTLNVIHQPLGSIDALTHTSSGLLCIGLFDNKLQEVYTLAHDDSRLQLTRFNTLALADKYIAKPQHITYERDGQPLDGWVLLPQDYSSESSYPAILDIHGGPKTIYSDVFYHEMQVWANLGYIVFFTNPRGGDAFGDEFADIRGKYGTVDYEDIMTFTDIVLEKYAIDPARVGVTGGSYGGFMTNWIVSHTDRFKAAATQRSISNWISFYGTSDIGTYFGSDQTAANPFDNIEDMWEQSPLKHAKNIKTPLLIFHSEEDYRCPIEQAMQLFTVVKLNGVESRFVWMKGENHDLSRSGKPQSRVKRLEEITTWFENRL